jgi:hypothetical protein
VIDSNCPGKFLFCFTGTSQDNPRDDLAFWLRVEAGHHPVQILRDFLGPPSLILDCGINGLVLVADVPVPAAGALHGPFHARFNEVFDLLSRDCQRTGVFAKWARRRRDHGRLAVNPNGDMN